MPIPWSFVESLTHWLTSRRLLQPITPPSPDRSIGTAPKFRTRQLGIIALDPSPAPCTLEVSLVRLSEVVGGVAWCARGRSRTSAVALKRQSRAP